MFYAQHQEDEKLVHLLFPEGGVKDNGFYIDIGAWEPEIDSVTKFFYDLGWSGINVEPVQEYYDKLMAARPRDINLRMAVDNAGATFREFNHIVGTGLSTFHEENAKNGSNNREMKKILVPTMRLCDLLRCYVPPGRKIDFMKVDVEGWEGNVLRSNDWARFRPKILVVEATVPGTFDSTAIPAWEDWDAFVLNQNYEFLEFDGLNRWYRDRG